MRFKLRFRLWKVSRVGHRQSNLRWSLKLLRFGGSVSIRNHAAAQGLALRSLGADKINSWLAAKCEWQAASPDPHGGAKKSASLLALKTIKRPSLVLIDCIIIPAPVAITCLLQGERNAGEYDAQ